jgi:hypothetical protein
MKGCTAIGKIDIYSVFPYIKDIGLAVSNTEKNY